MEINVDFGNKINKKRKIQTIRFIYFFSSISMAALLLVENAKSKENSSFTGNRYFDVLLSHAQLITKGWRKTKHRDCFVNHFNRWKLCRLKSRLDSIWLLWLACAIYPRLHCVNSSKVEWVNVMAYPVQTIGTTRNMFAPTIRAEEYYKLTEYQMNS